MIKKKSTARHNHVIILIFKFLLFFFLILSYETIFLSPHNFFSLQKPASKNIHSVPTHSRVVELISSASERKKTRRKDAKNILVELKIEEVKKLVKKYPKN